MNRPGERGSRGVTLKCGCRVVLWGNAPAPDWCPDHPKYPNNGKKWG